MGLTRIPIRAIRSVEGPPRGGDGDSRPVSTRGEGGVGPALSLQGAGPGSVDLRIWIKCWDNSVAPTVRFLEPQAISKRPL